MEQQYLFSRTPEFQALLIDLTAVEGAGVLVQGVVIDLHPVWKRLYQNFLTTGANLDHFTPHPWHLMIQASLGELAGMGFYDLDWRSTPWKKFCEEANKATTKPFVVKICTVQPPPQAHTVWRGLVALAQRQPFFTTLEVRPLARAAAAVEGGCNVDADEPGTIGGFLQDQAGNILGLTCAHVAQTVGQSVTLPDLWGARYPNAGSVVATNYNALQNHVGPQLCNPYGGGVALADLDAALISLTGTLTPSSRVAGLGDIDDIYGRAQCQSGQKVYMYGAVSRLNAYTVGGYGATYRVLFPDGNYYCFTNLFEIIGHSSAPVPARVAAALAPRAQSGDSGAWICCDSPSGNYAFCGTLMATDSGIGFATFTDPLRSWAGGLGYRLAVI